MPLSAAEQYMLELVNRARLDPLAEANRQKIGLNKDLAQGTLDGDARQVLAPDSLLEDAAESHSDWMLRTDVFSHSGHGGSSPHDRMKASGFVFDGNWSSGENIAWSGSTGSISLSREIQTAHNGLFKSAGHRLNILADQFREIGISQEEGVFQGYNASMVTQNFAAAGSTVFVTGVAYEDGNGNNFYNIGEGVSGVVFQSGGTGTETAQSGGYSLGLTGRTADVTVDWANGDASVRLDLSNGNAKLDLLDGAMLASSANLTILDGNARGAQLLGIADLSLEGGDRSEHLVGNKGDNVIEGGGGNDRIEAGLGDDHVTGGAGADTVKLARGHDIFDAGIDDTSGDVVRGGGGRDRIDGGGGNDTLSGQGGADTILGGDGDDLALGGRGRDQVFLGDGDDIYRDARQGGEGGRDLVSGGAGDDLLITRGGDDTLDGGTGNDTLHGGRGSDTFVFADDFAEDRIKDYSVGLDMIELATSLWDGNKSAANVVSEFATVSRGSVIFDFGGGNQLLLEDVSSLAGLADDLILSG